MNQIFAGYADKNASLFRRLGLPLGDPSALVHIGQQPTAIVRDLEMDRVRQGFRGDVTCPADHAPASGLSADRETATAQATANFVAESGIKEIHADRSLPFIFVWHLQQLGIEVVYDAELGVLDRRGKTEEEIASLQRSQATTEQVMQQILQAIANASTDKDGLLIYDGDVLTSERVRTMAAVWFLERGFTMEHGAICASVPDVADCHHRGTGPLMTERPVIVDLFPRCEETRYWGDCTRTVVHGCPSDEVKRMHAAVVDAKAKCTAMLVTGNTAADAHAASERTLIEHGYATSRGTLTDQPSIQHGTGHGIGLEVHEPILLDAGGGAMMENEVFTVEPGLYGRKDGGVRVEDMIIVTKDGPVNLNQLPEGLDWRA